MKVGIPKEIHSGEKRVATTPDVVSQIQNLGYKVAIEAGAGESANYADEDYWDNNAEVMSDRKRLWSSVDIILKVRPPKLEELDYLHAGQTLICFFWPAQNESMLEQLRAMNITVLAMDCIPRITRAQKMDALSTMANISGYRAVIEATHQFDRFMSGQITAAGKINPAKVLVIGAGVAGLSAIAIASSLGAIVYAFDTRPEVKEQVESMGADFLYISHDEDGSGDGGYAKTMSSDFLAAEKALLAEQAENVDIIITTALIPGKPAPVLITKDMVSKMKNGSVIVDLAIEQGGNCESSIVDKTIETPNGVKVIAYADLPSRLAAQSSQLYANNLRHLLADLTPQKDGQLNIDFKDEIIRSATIVHEEQITWPPPPPKEQLKPVVTPTDAKKPEQKAADKKENGLARLISLSVLACLVILIGSFAPASFMSHFTVFVLACFIGYMVIWNVSPSLHTPLMSVTNAISSIIIIAALVQISSSDHLLVSLAAIGTFITSINIAGGFAVTRRMLAMFKK